MKTFATFLLLLLIKLAAKVFYYVDVTWVKKGVSFRGERLIVLLNHTSLFEPIYLSVLPVSLLWKFAKKGVLPGADITMSRPIVGWFFRLVSSSTIPISRRRDKTWAEFLNRVGQDSLILIAAEGRMKRPNGLDKEGNPMTVRGGVSDLLERIEGGKILIAYSGGLHHVMKPDENFPRLFKRLKLTLDILDLNDYKKTLGFGGDSRVFRLAVVRDLEQRRDLHCPNLLRQAEIQETVLSRNRQDLSKGMTT